MRVRLAPGGDSLPELLKPFADILMHLWPVKGAGDGKLVKVHSPLHAMLTLPLAKSQEEEIDENKRRGGKASLERIKGLQPQLSLRQKNS